MLFRSVDVGDDAGVILRPHCLVRRKQRPVGQDASLVCVSRRGGGVGLASGAGIGRGGRGCRREHFLRISPPALRNEQFGLEVLQEFLLRRLFEE